MTEEEGQSGRGCGGFFGTGRDCVLFLFVRLAVKPGGAGRAGSEREGVGPRRLLGYETFTGFARTL